MEKISVNKLWKSSGKKVSFKEFLTDYNKGKGKMNNFDGGCQQADGFDQQAAVVTDYFPSPAPQQYLHKKIIVSEVVRRGVDTKELLFYGGIGLMAGVLVGLLIKKL